MVLFPSICSLGFVARSHLWLANGTTISKQGCILLGFLSRTHPQNVDWWATHHTLRFRRAHTAKTYICLHHIVPIRKLVFQPDKAEGMENRPKCPCCGAHTSVPHCLSSSPSGGRWPRKHEAARGDGQLREREEVAGTARRGSMRRWRGRPAMGARGGGGGRQTAREEVATGRRLTTGAPGGGGCDEEGRRLLASPRLGNDTCDASTAGAGWQVCGGARAALWAEAGWRRWAGRLAGARRRGCGATWVEKSSMQPGQLWVGCRQQERRSTRSYGRAVQQRRRRRCISTEATMQHVMS